jgi:hypothetical protein
VNTSKRPSCPLCRKPRLERQFSGFALTGRAKENAPSGAPEDLPINERHVERAMNQLASEAQRLNPDSPQDEARLMRRFSEMTGIRFGDKMNDAIDRLEQGEDMAQVEKEMGDALDGDELPFALSGRKSSVARRPPPRRDSTLYEM